MFENEENNFENEECDIVIEKVEVDDIANEEAEPGYVEYTVDQPAETVQMMNNDYNSNSYYVEQNDEEEKPKKSFSLKSMIAVSVITSILFGTICSFVVFNLINYNRYEGGDIPAITQPVTINENDAPATAVSKKVTPSTVGVVTTYMMQTQMNPIFGGESSEEAQGTGSGIIVDIKGETYIITNHHVIGDALDEDGKLKSDARVEVVLASDNNVEKKHKAEVVGTDSESDLALLKINVKNLPPVKIGDSDKLQTGETAFAIGNPAGLEFMGSITKGIISGLDRRVGIAKNTTQFSEVEFIQTDAAISPGNSGGALVNVNSEVIGINTMKTVSDGFEGMGYAIPINYVMKIVEQLAEHGTVVGRPTLGIKWSQQYSADVLEGYNMPRGVYVVEVVPSSAAFYAGIKVGDIITKFDGQAVETVTDINLIKNKKEIGDEVKIEVFRDDKTLTLTAVLKGGTSKSE